MTSVLTRLTVKKGRHNEKAIRKGVENVMKGLPGGTAVTNLPANNRDTGSMPGSGDPLEEKMATTTVLLSGKFHGQRHLVSYGPWRRKE